MAEARRLRAAVIGAGNFGRYHASKYAAMKDVELVGIVDSNLKAAKRLAQEHGCRAFYNTDILIGRVDLVSIATPATTHRRIACQLLEAGIHVYVEKPLACTLEDADAILAAAKKHNRIVAVGHQERYILNRLYLDAQETPQLVECHRLNQWTGRATDVDVALDLMIHDIDLVLQLAPGSVAITSSTGHDPDRPCNNDIKATLTIGGACKARLHASRMAKKQTRTMRIQYPTGSVFIDFVACKIEDTRPITLKAKFSDLMNGADGVAYDPLGLALVDFVRCVRTGREPFVSGIDGRRALSVTLVLLQASRTDSTALSIPDREKNVPLFDLETPAERLRADVDRRIAQVLDHRQYINGPEVSELETALANYTGAKYCLSCSSGTTALTIALMGENLTDRDAVLLPAFTYNATCNAIITAGATPVYVDVDRKTCNICPKSLVRTIERLRSQGHLRPAVIIAVDLYGLPAEYTSLASIAADYNMAILADAAQSLGGSQLGRRVGALAPMTATSFYPSKTLSGFGDGGALITDDAARYERWKSIRWHGTDEARGESVRVGLNGRLDSLQCAVLLAKLAVFEEEMEGRRRIARWYHSLLQGRVQMQKWDEGHANGLFTVILGDPAQRDFVKRTLQASGVSTGVYYAKPLHKHRAFQQYVLEGQRLPNAEWLAARVLSLPMSPYMREEQVARVCAVLLSAIYPETRQMQQAKL